MNEQGAPLNNSFQFQHTQQQYLPLVNLIFIFNIVFKTKQTPKLWV